ncbi:TPA: hypothetical protein ACN976_004169 [Vibrio campbellii]
MDRKIKKTLAKNLGFAAIMYGFPTCFFLAIGLIESGDVGVFEYLNEKNPSWIIWLICFIPTMIAFLVLKFDERQG